MGSLLTAVASWLDARASGGRWLLRIDDLDAPRIDPDAETAILATLDAHGLGWDGEVRRQSDFRDRHAAALDALWPRCFACRCSRRDLGGRPVYPGTCRDLGLARGSDTSVRMRVGDARVDFTDRVQGPHREALAETTGDFIVWRRDGMAAYPLAVVVDDDCMGVTDVLRGADLVENTPRQLFIAGALALRRPTHAHVPVIVEANGAKLSKHTGATAVDDRHAAANLSAVLTLLGFAPPALGTVREALDWGVANWRIDQVPAAAAIDGFVALS